MLIQLEDSIENCIVHAVLELYPAISIEQSGETIGLLHDHSKTGRFSVRPRLCPFEYKNYIMHRYYYLLPGSTVYRLFAIIFWIMYTFKE